MNLRRLLFIALLPVSVAAQTPIDSLLSLIKGSFNARAAYEDVKYFTQFWKIAGGKEFSAWSE